MLKKLRKLSSPSDILDDLRRTDGENNQAVPTLTFSKVVFWEYHCNPFYWTTLAQAFVLMCMCYTMCHCYVRPALPSVYLYPCPFPATKQEYGHIVLRSQLTSMLLSFLVLQQTFYKWSKYAADLLFLIAQRVWRFRYWH